MMKDEDMRKSLCIFWARWTALRESICGLEAAKLLAGKLNGLGGQCHLNARCTGKPSR